MPLIGVACTLTTSWPANFLTASARTPASSSAAPAPVLRKTAPSSAASWINLRFMVGQWRGEKHGLSGLAAAASMLMLWTVRISKPNDMAEAPYCLYYLDQINSWLASSGKSQDTGLDRRPEATVVETFGDA